MFLPDGETVWKTKPLADAEALTVLDVRDDNRESVFLLCFRNDPLEDWNNGNVENKTLLFWLKRKSTQYYRFITLFTTQEASLENNVRKSS